MKFQPNATIGSAVAMVFTGQRNGINEARFMTRTHATTNDSRPRVARTITSALEPGMDVNAAHDVDDKGVTRRPNAPNANTVSKR